MIKSPLPPEVLRRCRELRRKGTPAETLLGSILRDRRLGGFKFRRQHPAVGYILDFYCHDAQLVVELDGGGHAEDGQARYAEVRTRDLQAAGLRVLRFWNSQVDNQLEDVVAEIWQALHSP